MIGDKIFFRGQICDASALIENGNGATIGNGNNVKSGVGNGDVDGFLSGCFAYQRIHVVDGEPKHISIHLDLLTAAHKTLFGVSANEAIISASEVSSAISKLYKANIYRDGSYEFRLYHFCDCWLLSCHKKMFYKGYTLWHSRPSAIVVPCAAMLSVRSLGAVPSSFSLSAAAYADSLARRKGAEVALSEKDGILTGVGDYPLFGVRDGQIYTSPLECGATDSVERRLIFRATGADVIEKPILAEQAKLYDEFFYADTQGVVSLLKYNGTLLFNLVAQRIAERLG